MGWRYFKVDIEFVLSSLSKYSNPTPPHEQFQNVGKLGPLSSVMNMIPGLSGLMDKNTEGASQDKFKKLTVIMDSMSDYELDHSEANKLFRTETKRRDRVARGSGTSPEEVEEVLMQYQKLSAMVKKMGGMKSLFKDGPGGLGGLGGGGQPNPRDMAQLQQSMAKMIDPRVLNQMGGMGGLNNLMKQFTGGGMQLPGGMQMPPGMENMFR